MTPTIQNTFIASLCIASSLFISACDNSTLLRKNGQPDSLTDAPSSASQASSSVSLNQNPVSEQQSATHKPTNWQLEDPNWVYCSTEREYCSFSGTKIVRFGSAGSYVAKAFVDGVYCGTQNFPDPAFGSAKECQINLGSNAGETAVPPSEADEDEQVLSLLESSISNTETLAKTYGSFDFVFNSDVTNRSFQAVLETDQKVRLNTKVIKNGKILRVSTDKFLDHDTGYTLTLTDSSNQLNYAASKPGSFDNTSLANALQLHFRTEKANFEGFLPFDQATPPGPVNPDKLVFAHYITSYPLMINNNPPGQDYYDLHYLNPEGEDAQYLPQGGYLRERPLSRAPFDETSDWRMTDARFEVNQAVNIGLDGFTLNILEVDGNHWDRINRLYDAAEEVDGFKIVIMPDMNSVFRRDPSTFVPAVINLAKRPATYRLKDGRVVVAPYMAENQSPTWWKNALQELETHGIKVALVPVYQGWESELARFKEEEPEAFEEYVIGISDWGSRTPSGAEKLKMGPETAHQYGKIWMGPVAPQDSRPKSSIYTEAGNSDTYRGMWSSAINNNADWVQLITWNDYSETTEIAPSSSIGYSFYDLSAYYIQWFKTGQQPQVKRDVIYAFYRKHHTSAQLSSNALQKIRSKSVNGANPKNEIELLAFLTAPATLEIEVGGETFQQYAPNSGITSFKIPLREGSPTFRIVRENLIVTELNGPWEINNTIDIQDFTYHGATSSRLNTVGNSQLLSWPQKIDPDSNTKFSSLESNSPFHRKSNKPAKRLSIQAQELVDGYRYRFIPKQDGNKIVVNFDLFLEEECKQGSALLFNIANSSEVFASLELCNGDSGTLSLMNRTLAGSEVLEPASSSELKPQSWYQFELTINKSLDLFSAYNLLLTRPDGTKKQFKNLSFLAPTDILNEIQFTLETNNKSQKNFRLDNVNVDIE